MNFIYIEQEEETILSQHEVFPVSNLGAIPRGFDGRPVMEWIDEPASVGDLGQRGSGEFNARFGDTVKTFNTPSYCRQIPWAKNALQKWEKATNSYQPMTPTSPYNALKYTECGWTQVDEIRAKAFINYWNAKNSAKILLGYPVSNAPYSVLTDSVIGALQSWVNANTSPSGSYGQYGGQLFGVDDEPASVGQVDDPCVTIQNEINKLNGYRQQIISDANAAAIQAAQAGAPQSQIDAIVAQKNSAVATIDGQLGELKKLLANCKNMAPGCDPQTPCPAGMVCVDGKCVTPTAPPPPQCGPNKPCPAGQECVAGVCVPKTTSAAKPKSRSWLLLAVGGLAAGFFALKGA